MEMKMKNFGKSRGVDVIGRLVIPSVIRKSFGLKKKDELLQYIEVINGVKYLVLEKTKQSAKGRKLDKQYRIVVSKNIRDELELGVGEDVKMYILSYEKDGTQIQKILVEKLTVNAFFASVKIVID